MIAIQNVLPMSPHVPLPISQVHTLVRGEVGESRLKSGVAGRGATPDTAPTPTRLTATQDTEAAARRQHHFLIRCKRKVRVGATARVPPHPSRSFGAPTSPRTRRG